MLQAGKPPSFLTTLPTHRAQPSSHWSKAKHPPPFAVLLLWQHSRCVSACGLYSSIAKPPRKCLLCVGDLWLGSLSPDSLPSRIWSWVPLLTPTSSALWYSFLSGREILLFSYQLPVELQFREVEERSSTVTLIDLYLSLFHHRMH